MDAGTRNGCRHLEQWADGLERQTLCLGIIRALRRVDGGKRGGGTGPPRVVEWKRGREGDRCQS